ncbi:GLPGLI family protein [Flavobacterium sp.]|uniref:GLPGLI family protein n=1 Tax=Flavobacterium sp. TaxID=239 RepID=UPI00262AF776|nr:GLPGLI family protein [Flavobacterium sp.]
MLKFLFLFLICSVCVAQNNCIKVVYNAEVIDIAELTKANNPVESLFKAAKENASALRFDLSIISGCSLFKARNMLSTSANGDVITTSMPFLDYSGEVYRCDKEVLRQILILGSKTYLKKIDAQDWNITAETKLIDTYVCYKATSIRVVQGIDKVFHQPITAWFCPNLPFSFGPNGYGGLPGLILELQVHTSFYKAMSIETIENCEVKPRNFETIKVVTETELNQMLDKFMEEE